MVVKIFSGGGLTENANGCIIDIEILRGGPSKILVMLKVRSKHNARSGPRFVYISLS